MEPKVSSDRIASLAAAVLLVVVVFAVPIVTFVAFGDTVGSHTLYEAALDAFDRGSRTVAISFALVLITAAVGLYVAHGLGAHVRYAIIASLAAIVSVVPLVIYHASAQRIEVFGFEVASTSIAFGVFVPAIIGVVHVLIARFA